MKECIVIGGGIIGLCSAYYLTLSGHKVTIIDEHNFDTGCSHGNAGMIVPSHFIPLAQPGMISQGIRWMFDSKSPFYVKPRLSSELVKWGLSFYKHATKAHVERSIPALLDLSLFSKELFQDLSRECDLFEYEEKGLLMLFQSIKIAEEEIHIAERAKQLGLQVKTLNKQEIQTVESGVNINAIGGIHYESDAHLSPNKLIQFLKNKLMNSGTQFVSGTKVKDFLINGSKIFGIITEDQLTYTCDEVILCTGAFSAEIAQKADLKLSILAGKGYSFNCTINSDNHPTVPSILCEGKVAVTPMNNYVRFGGTMEITSPKDTKINMNRIEGITNTIRSFYPDYQFKKPAREEIWYGFRPCTPTGTPIIGRASKWDNFTVATGHSMMGLSLAPATGKIVADLIQNVKPTVKIDAFAVL